MKIAITGHTSGIGLALTKQCNNWIGFSRSNGYDINNPKPWFHRQAMRCDVFVNNAHDRYAQVDLLYKVWEEWKDQNKQIVCISSVSPDVTKNKMWTYSTEKCALNHACEQLQNSKGKCRIINIKPGYIDTPRVAGTDEYKMDPNYIAKLILWSIRQPEYLMTLRINPYQVRQP